MTTNQKVVGSNPAGLTSPKPMKSKAPGIFLCLRSSAESAPVRRFFGSYYRHTTDIFQSMESTTASSSSVFVDWYFVCVNV